MTVALILLIAFFAVAALTALVRGLMAFHGDAERIRHGADPLRLQYGVKQNRMMIQRVLFQGIAILLVAALGLIAAKQ